MQATAHLARSADNALISERAFVYTGASYSLADWSRDNAALFQEELARASQAIAERIVAEMVDPHPVNSQPAYLYLLRARAAENDRQAQYELGLRSAKTPEVATEWWEKAATGGHVEAQYRLAQALEEQATSLADQRTSLMWYIRAARNGHAEARTRLAKIDPRERKRMEEVLSESLDLP